MTEASGDGDYKDLLQCTELQEVLLVGQKCIGHVHSSMVTNVETVKFQPEFAFGYSLTQNLENNTQTLNCFLDFSLNISYGDDQKPLSELRITYCVLYSVATNTPFGDAELARFCHKQGFIHATPFLREHIQSTLSKMNMPHFLLPVLRSDQLYKAKNLNDQIKNQVGSVE